MTKEQLDLIAREAADKFGEIVFNYNIESRCLHGNKRWNGLSETDKWKVEQLFAEQISIEYQKQACHFADKLMGPAL